MQITLFYDNSTISKNSWWKSSCRRCRIPFRMFAVTPLNWNISVTYSHSDKWFSILFQTQHTAHSLQCYSHCFIQFDAAKVTEAECKIYLNIFNTFALNTFFCLFVCCLAHWWNWTESRAFQRIIHAIYGTIVMVLLE